MEHPVRATICRWLQTLPGEFAGFEQTTHGHIHLEQGIGDVLACVAEAYDNPGAYTISNASQAIKHFAKDGGP